MSAFKKAVRSQAKLRLALLGPSGAGKTYTALAIAKHLGKRIAVIDTERGSASLYAGDVADFDVLELESFSPANYVRAIREAEKEGYDVIVVDSLTHAWSGKGGAIEMVDIAAKKQRSQNSFTAWRDVTPEHNALVDALVGCKVHLISTMRVKTAYELQENDNGKKVPVKIGLEPIQRSGLEYEFTVVGDMDLDHNLTISKTRCSLLDGGLYKKPGQNIAETLLGWLNSGAEPTPKPAAAPEPEHKRESAESPFATDDGPSLDDRVSDLTSQVRDCSSAAELQAWATMMVALVGKVSSKGRGADAWRAFAARCGELDMKPGDVIANVPGAR